MIEKELMAPCGLYCGVCGVLVAHRENNLKFKERLATVYHCAPEDVSCKGCLSDERFFYCRTCGIRSCTEEKGLAGCHQCGEFPCRLIEDFPVPVGKKVILRATPARRELGDEKWVEAEEQRYVCPHCSYQLFRGTKRCRSCREPVDLD